MDTEELVANIRFAGWESYVEGLSRILAAVFLGVVVILLLRASRRSSSDIWIGLVFGSWLLVLLNNAFRFVVGFPPQYIHWSVYGVIAILEIGAMVQMVRESRRIRAIQERERRRLPDGS